jgi:hypothetical protein
MSDPSDPPMFAEFAEDTTPPADLLDTDPLRGGEYGHHMSPNQPHMASGSGSSQGQMHLASSPSRGTHSGTFTLGGGSGSVPHHVVSLNSPDAQNRNVYVASLPGNFGDENLRDLFTPYGTIVSSKMFNNDGRPNSHGRAYGFVMFADEGSVQKAIDSLVGAVVGSQRIQVRRAKPNSRGPSQPGSSTASPANSNSQAHLMPQGYPSQGVAGGPPGYVMMPMPQQQPVALQQIGINHVGQPVYALPNGQHVMLAPGHAPTAAAPPLQPPHAQQHQQYVMMPGATNAAPPVFMMAPQSGQPAGGAYYYGGAPQQ